MLPLPPLAKSKTLRELIQRNTYELDEVHTLLATLNSELATAVKAVAAIQKRDIHTSPLQHHD